MSAALIAALFFTVALLVVTMYFILGSIPLLVLQHDTPLDARFVRGFFNIYYKGAFITALATGASYALAGRPLVAGGAVALAGVAVGLRRQIIPAMEKAGAGIQDSGAEAIRRFRRLHVMAIVLNLAQLGVIVWSLIAASRSAMPGAS